MVKVQASIESNLGVKDIHKAIDQLGGYGSIFVPEFTFHDMRIDGILVEPGKTRRIRGFEIKVSRPDFIRDGKWQNYTQFCSSLSIACPEGLIRPDEIESPFGLLWVKKETWVRDHDGYKGTAYHTQWAKRPKDFQGTKGLAWTWRYLEVLEAEFKRLAFAESSHRNSL